jgi:hypothetical protein
LRSRAAALLATETDSGSRIFRDVGYLYAIRSKLVHGSTLELKELKRLLRRVVSEGNNELGREPFARAVDRLRDLVRRSILARVVLAADQDNKWSFGETVAVDSELADDKTRELWRERWRGTLSKMGLEAASEPLPEATGLFS